MLDTCANCWMGWVKFLTYWMNAWMSPMVIAPAAAKNTARHSYGHVPQVAHKVHDGLHQAGEELAFPRGFVQFIVGGIEICEHGVLTIESLDDVVAGVDLLDLAIDNAQRCLLRLKNISG